MVHAVTIIGISVPAAMRAPDDSMLPCGMESSGRSANVEYRRSESSHFPAGAGPRFINVCPAKCRHSQGEFR
jgi:hypothetical protein